MLARLKIVGTEPYFLAKTEKEFLSPNNCLPLTKLQDSLPPRNIVCVGAEISYAQKAYYQI